MPKFVITKNRFIDGQLVLASPHEPAIIELPKGTKVDKGLKPYEEGDEIEKPIRTEPGLAETVKGTFLDPVSTADDGKPKKGK